VKALYDVTRPGLMLSQVWPRSRERDGETHRALETAIGIDRFAAYQTVEIPYRTERRAVGRAIRDQGLQYTYCLTRVLADNELNLSSLQENTRRRSCEQVFRCLDHAREAGADSVSLTSGARPDEEAERQQALQALAESMKAIVKKAVEPPAVSILLEPLDVVAHKRMTLGYTQEAVDLCRQLASEDLRLQISLDTAHTILNNEAPEKCLLLAKEYVSDFHYCNCVTDKSSALYGDNHIPFGPPGVVDVERISRIMKAQMDMSYFDSIRRPVIMCEVLNSDDHDPEGLMHYCIDTMEAAWSKANDIETAEAAI